MKKEAEPDFIKVTEIFLVPSSFLVAALGTADTNFHRAGVSVIGLVVGIMWWACSREALFEPDPHDGNRSSFSRRTKILSLLPPFFCLCWVLSTAAHLMLWNKPLGHP